MSTDNVESRVRLRANVLFLLLLFVLGLLTCRIAAMQIRDARRYSTLKALQLHREEVLVAERGKILDDNVGMVEGNGGNSVTKHDAR